MKQLKKTLSLFLVLVLVATVLPTSAFAAESSSESEAAVASETEETASSSEEIEEDTSDTAAEETSSSTVEETETVGSEETSDSSESTSAEATESEEDTQASSQTETVEEAEEEEETEEETEETQEEETLTDELELEEEEAVDASYTSYSYSYTYNSLNDVTLNSSTPSLETVLTEATTFIISQEGDYDSVNKDDNGALSIGVLQWHGNNALILMRLIVSANNATAYSKLGSTLYNEIISSSTSWTSRTLTSSEASKISACISTSTGEEIQTELAESFIASYINSATTLGLRDAGALLIYADVANQRGNSNAKSTAADAKALAGSYSAITANEMLMASIYNYPSSSSYYSTVVKRRLASYQYIVETLGWSYGDYLIAYNVSSAESTATEWLQAALNAIDDADLTVNGTYNSSTESAVISYQSSRGLDADGIPGTLTISSIIKELYEYLEDGGTLEGITSSGESDDEDAESTLSISNYNYPTTLEEGESFSIYGKITSNYTISKVVVKIYTSDWEVAIRVAATPNSTSYNISSLDSSVKFGSLEPGDYIYKVYASDSKQTDVQLLRAEFTVEEEEDAESTLSISSYNYPTSIDEGDSFSVSGKITSNYTISKVVVKVYTSDWDVALRVAVTPNSTSYNLSSLASSVKFSSLEAGDYIYKVYASDAKQTDLQLLRAEFTVEGEDAESTLSISNYNYPTSIDEGDSFSIYGKITSNYTISKVVVKIYTSDWDVALRVAVTPNSKSYNLSSLDSSVKFGSLEAGDYIYKVYASDSKQTDVQLLRAEFTVEGELSTLSLSNYNYPTSISKGSSFSIYGKITSNYTITKVVVKIYDSDGDVVIRVAAKPNSKSYNVSKLDSSVKFGSLSKGTYTYRIYASDATQSNTLLLKKTFKVT